MCADVAILLSEMATPKQDYTHHAARDLSVKRQFNLGIVDTKQISPATVYTYKVSQDFEQEVNGLFDSAINMLQDHIGKRDIKIPYMDYLEAQSYKGTEWDKNGNCLRGHPIIVRNLYHLNEPMKQDLLTQVGNSLDSPEKVLEWFEAHQVTAV